MQAIIELLTNNGLYIGAGIVVLATIGLIFNAFGLATNRYGR